VPNSLAYLMLMLWPLVVLVLFTTQRAERAFVWSILGGYLILPPVAAFDMPLIPDLDKITIPALSVLVVATLFKGHRIALLPRSPVLGLVVVLFVLSPFATALTNGEPVTFVEQPLPWAPTQTVARTLPGLVPYDGLAMALGQVFTLITFTLARHFLATPAALRELLMALAIGGLAYTPLMLLEIRLSPQLNIWVYGFFQHDWLQMVRSGGFRPIVFLTHGLWVAFFGLTAVLAAAGLARFEPQNRMRHAAAALWLLAVLALCKTLGVMIYAAAFLPVLLFAPPRMIVRVSVLLAGLVFVYPILRATDLVPVNGIVDFFNTLSAARAQSLGFRFYNEDVLMEHALRKPWFGWGAFERNLVLDPATGRAVSVSDGRWVITFGILGSVGYGLEFALYLIPLILLARLPGAVEPAVAVVALILAVNLVDLLPNATLTPITWLMLGGIVGYTELVRRETETARRAHARTMRRRTVL
jgi:hypothetical protein